MKRDIYYFSGTHWDREWYQTFQGFRFRLVQAMNDLCHAWETQPEFGVFHLDGQTIPLEDYAEIEPENAEKIKELVKEGKIKIGPWYVMPDEFNISGESFIRNLMIGHELSKKWGAEEAWKFGYICDIFGHIAQTPQIFQGFQINYSLFSRGYYSDTEPYFIWRSPDGSSVLNLRMGNLNGYGEFAVRVGDKGGTQNRTPEEAKEDFETYMDFLLSTTQYPVHIVMDAVDHHPLRKETVDYIRAIENRYPDATVHHVDLIEAAKHIDTYREKLEVITGEMNYPNKAGFPDLITNVLSSHYPLKQQNDRCQNRLEKVIEPLMAYAKMAGMPYPRNYVSQAYRYLIQNHPHDSIGGCSIDQVHKDMVYRYDQTEEICDALQDDYFVTFGRKQGYQEGEKTDAVLTLYNTLPFDRNEVITVKLPMRPQYEAVYHDQSFGFETVNSFRIYDAEGKEIPYQLKSIRRNQKMRLVNQFWKFFDMHEISLQVNVPAGGFSEYRVVPSEKPSRYLKHMTSGTDYMENEYIRVDIKPWGTIDITDKKTGRVYKNQLNLADDSEIGDGWYHANAREEKTVYSASGKCRIEKVESGCVRCVFRITKEMEVPDSLIMNEYSQYRSDRYIACKAVFEVGLSEQARFADVKMTYENNAENHRVRLVMPTATEGKTYFADQAFYCCTRRTGIDYSTQDWREYDQYEKSMNGIVGKRDDKGCGLAFVSCEGLHECASTDDENATLYITLLRGFQKTVMTNGETRGQVLGTHTYRFLLAPLDEAVSFTELVKLKDSMSAPLMPRYAELGKEEAILAPQAGLRVSGENICLSMFKCAEREDAYIVRVYNASDEPSAADVDFGKKVVSAELTNLNEERTGETVPIKEKSVSFAVSPWQIRTVIVAF